jgi:hypothetical protein
MSSSPSPEALDIERALQDKLISTAFANRALDQRMLTSIAAELAMDINTVDNILRNHGLTRVDLDRIVKMPNFQTLYQEALIAWGSTASAATRIKAKMESMVEQALPALFAELQKDGLSPSKVELVKTFMRGGGIGEKAAGTGTGEGGVSIVINMDSSRERKAVTIEGSLSREAEDV